MPTEKGAVPDATDETAVLSPSDVPPQGPAGAPPLDPLVEDRGDDEGPVHPLVKLAIALLILLGLGAAAVALLRGNDEKVDEALATANISEATLALQTDCFNAGYFYDDDGVCYSVDPTGLSSAELAAARVELANAPEAPVDPAVEPVAPGGAPAGPVAPGSQVAPSGGQTAAPTPNPAPPTPDPATQTPAPATSTSKPATTTSKPPAPKPPVNIANSEWKWVIAPDPPPGQDPNSYSYSARFQVVDGKVSGGPYREPSLEDNVTWSGTINPDGSTGGGVNPDGSTNDLKAKLDQKGSFSFAGAVLNSPDNPQTISGRYVRTYNNGKTESGSFTLTKRS